MSMTSRTESAPISSSPSALSPPGQPELDHVAGELRITINRLAYVMRRPGTHGLTPSRYTALSVLRRQGAMRIGDLAQLMSVSAPTVTRLVDALDELGLVSRGRDSADGRVTVISLSDHGREVIEQIRRDATSELRDEIAGLSASDQKALRAALPALIQLADGLLDQAR